MAPVLRRTALALLLAGAGAPAASGADAPPVPSTPPVPAPRRAVPAAVRRALDAYLEAPAKKEQAARDRLLGLLGTDLRLAVEAIRTREPLVAARPGAQHGVTFSSGGATWEYGVRFPPGYDGKRRFPVLVLPDHALVDSEAGLGFWDGKEGAQAYVLFRPVVAKHQEDRARFPDAQFFARDQAMARVFHDALVALRLRYAVDPGRFVMTGLSQAGYYTWYYAATWPDEFAGIVPESAGGLAPRAAVLPLAGNLAGLSIRILHARGDRVCPFADAEALRDAVARAGGRPELIAYEDADYGAEPPPKRHPGPAAARLAHVLPWGATLERTIPRSFARVLRYAPQGFEGRWRLPPPPDVGRPVTVTCEERDDGTLRCDREGWAYLVDPEDVLARRVFRVGGRDVRPRPDLRLLLETFKATGDDGRLAAARIEP